MDRISKKRIIGTVSAVSFVVSLASECVLFGYSVVI